MIAILLLSILTTTTLTLTMSIEKTSIVYNSTTLPQIHSYYRYDDTNPFHLLTHLCYKQVDDGASGVIDLFWVCNDDEVCDELTCVINYYTVSMQWLSIVLCMILAVLLVLLIVKACRRRQLRYAPLV